MSIARDLAKANDDVSTRRDVSIAIEKLGNVKLSAGDKPAALAAYEEMLSIDRRAAEAEADNRAAAARGDVLASTRSATRGSPSTM